MKSKTCEHCGKQFVAAYRVKKAYWATRRFCSDECRIEGTRGESRSTKGVEKLSLKERFWSKVKRGKPTECWPWQGSCDLPGYGILGATRGNPALRAHRVAYELCVGQIPEGLSVLHKCDNPPCVNPVHLFLGTRADNNRDRAAKGRSGDHRGEKNRNAKLTGSQVEEIIACVESGETQTAVAKRYGIQQPHVSRIIRGHAWSR
jgi:hypothetical protein